jgi:hypothetical protein
MFKCLKHKTFSNYFLGAFTRVPKAIITFRYFCPTVRPHGKLGSHWTDFHENFISEDFSKICTENSRFIKSLYHIEIQPYPKTQNSISIFVTAKPTYTPAV